MSRRIAAGRRLGYQVVTATALGAAAVGVVLPVLPTTPFLLIAAWSASRHSPALETRLLAHPRFGPALRAWRRDRALSRRAKCCALSAMAVSLVITWSLSPDLLVKVLVTALLAAVAIWLVTRPEPTVAAPSEGSRSCG